MSRQALMEKAEEKRRTVLVNVTFKVRLDGSGALTESIDIPVDLGATLEDIKGRYIPEKANELRKKLEITASVGEVQFPEE